MRALRVLRSWLTRYRDYDAQIRALSESATNASRRAEELQVRVMVLESDLSKIRSAEADAVKRMADWLASRQFGQAIFDPVFSAAPPPTPPVTPPSSVTARELAAKARELFYADLTQHAAHPDKPQ